MKLKPFHHAGLLAALLFIFTAGQLRAELPPDAQEAMKKGIMAAKEQEWEIAIQSFQEARKSAPNAPELFYNLGLAESKLPGRELRAICWFGAYLAATTNAPNADAVKDAIAGLQIKSEGNIRRLIKTVQDAASQLPDVPKELLLDGKTYTKTDKDRMNGLLDVACLLAAVGNSDEAIQLAHRITETEDWNKTYALTCIVNFQADAGRIADAIKTASSFYDDNDTVDAQRRIAAAQVKAGDIAAAKETLTSARRTSAGVQSAYVRNSQMKSIVKDQADIGDISEAQTTAGLIPNPEDKSWAEISIADAQVAAGDIAGAKASLLVAQQGIDHWVSMTDSQKVTACECTLNPHEPRAELERQIGKSQIDAGDFAGARSTLCEHADKRINFFRAASSGLRGKIEISLGFADGYFLRP